LFYTEHLQPFSLFAALRRSPTHMQICGTAIETMDKVLGRLVYKIKGQVSAKNHLTVTDLNLLGPLLTIQISLIDSSISTFHLEVLTRNNLPLRITFSTLYDSPKFLGRSLR
jgi:hypothetical protein